MHQSISTTAKQRRYYCLFLATALGVAMVGTSCMQDRELVTVDPDCGNDVCELGEDHMSCPQDCEYMNKDAFPISGRLKVLPMPAVAYRVPDTSTIQVRVSMVNTGTGPVVVQFVEFVGGSDFVASIPDIFPREFDSGQGHTGLTVEYVGDPAHASEAYGELHVTTNDVTSPSQIIPVFASTGQPPHQEYTSGEGDALYSHVVVDPDPIVIESPSLGESVNVSVTIDPMGWIPAKVTWVEADHPDIAINHLPALPFTTSTSVELTYLPTSTIPSSTRLLIEYETATGYAVALTSPILIQ